MRYIELLEYSFPEIQHVAVKSDKHPGRAASRGDSEYVGGGSYGDAWGNPSRTPQDIRKLSNKPRHRDAVDGFYFYMLELEKHSDNANPYFPRIRAAKIYTEPHKKSGKENKNDKITYSVQMERLPNVLGGINSKEEESVMLRLFGENTETVNDLLGQMSHPYGQKLLTVIQTAIKSPTNTMNTVLIDNEFKRAAEFIRQVSEKYNLGYDLHDDNIMLRRGPTGIHLVITDPLSVQRATGYS